MRRLPHRNSIQLSLGWICLFWLGLAVTGWCRVAAVICAPVLWPGGTGFSSSVSDLGILALPQRFSDVKKVPVQFYMP